MTPGRAERARVIREVLTVLRNPMDLMTRPVREEAMRKAVAYNLTARELLEAAQKNARSA